MKRSILLLSLVPSLGFALAGCANPGSAPETSAATGPAGVGTAAETGAATVGGLGAGVSAGVPGGGY